MLHKNGVKVKEISNAAGTTVTIFAFDLVIARFTESINCKIGLSSNGVALLNVAVDTSLKDDKSQNLRQVERDVLSRTKIDGGEEKKKESKNITVTKTTTSGDNKPSIKIPNPQPLLFGSDHVKSEYTFLQFESR